MKKLEIFLKHILESIAAIETYLDGIAKDKFLRDSQIQDAVVRRIEIIGEAVKNLPLSFRKKYPHVPWRKIAGTRDIIIHEYFGLDLNLVWKITKKDPPELKNNISKILKEISSTHLL